MVSKPGLMTRAAHKSAIRIIGKVILSSAMGGFAAFNSGVAGLAQTPPFEWAVRAGGTNQEEAAKIAVDAAGNIYVAGTFHQATEIGGSNFVSRGDVDLFLAKYSNSGNIMWVKQVGTDQYDVVLGLSVDADSSIY